MDRASGWVSGGIALAWLIGCCLLPAGPAPAAGPRKHHTRSVEVNLDALDQLSPSDNAPAPEAMPALAPAPFPASPSASASLPAGSQPMVFFGFNRSAVTREGRAILRRFAADYRRGGNSRVIVTGHADAAGPQQYNMHLSVRRALAVERALARLGVPVWAMTVAGRGKAALLVPTGDGVPEPQNRRVEIALQ